MNNVSARIEASIGSFASSANALKSEVDDILSAYFATDASGFVDGLSSASTPATVSTKLTKGQYQNMIGTLQQVQKFFTNQVVTTGDYLNSIENVLHASAVLVTPLSNNVESIGERLKAAGAVMVGLYSDSKASVKAYNVSELGAAVTALSSQTIVFGSSTSASKFLSGVVLMDQFSRMIGNLSVTTADYLSTVLIWI
jgi:hypothetical protein